MSIFRVVQVILFIIMLLMAPAIIADYLPVEGDIIYQLDWELGDAELTEMGWQVNNDLGYLITVHEGYITSFNTTLIACEHNHGLFGWILEILSPSVAHAGHGSEEDAAMLDVSFVESLISPSTTSMGTVTVNEPSYCEGFYVLGQAHHLAENLPDDIDMLGNSLYISGEYTTPDGTSETFTIMTNVGWGTQSKLVLPSSDENTHAEIGEQDVTISIQRTLGNLFDGIDFEAMDETTITHALLRNLTSNTQFIVLTGKTHE